MYENSKLLSNNSTWAKFFVLFLFLFCFYFCFVLFLLYVTSIHQGYRLWQLGCPIARGNSFLVWATMSHITVLWPSLPNRAIKKRENCCKMQEYDGITCTTSVERHKHSIVSLMNKWVQSILSHYFKLDSTLRMDMR